MEENMISPDEINSVAYSKKRKLQSGLLGVPSPKHVCWGRSRECEFSSDMTIDPNKVTHPESINHSYSFPGDANSSSMSASAEPSSPSTCWDRHSSQIAPYSPENIKINHSKSDLTSFCEELHYPHLDFGFLPSECYNDHLLEFGSLADVSGAENKELEGILYSEGIDASNYVLSSGRWPVNQDGQEKAKSLTIDKEFEQYFSMLML